MPSLSGQNRPGSAIDFAGSLRVAVGGARTMRRSGRDRFWSPRAILTAAALVLTVHLAASYLLPTHGSVTCVGVGACYGVAAAAAYGLSCRASGMMRVRWRLLGIALGFGVFTHALTLYQESVLRTPDGLAGVQDVALVMRGIPFLLAVCLAKREIGWPFAVLDFLQLALIAFLATFALLFAGPEFLPVSSETALFWITTANVVTALLASVRCFGGVTRAERRFFTLVAGFLWLNTAVTGFGNFHAMRHPTIAVGAPLHVIYDLPLLGLAAMLCFDKLREDVSSGGRTDGNFFDALCSLFVPICGLLLAASIVPGHLHLGLGGVVVGFAVYGVRSTLVLKKALAAQQELLLTNRSMQDQAFSDALTGIANRRNFDLTLEREWKRAQRSRQPLALLMIDVDHFKKLNDQHGHLGGDTCLRQIAGLLRSGLGREADFAARYGGEEFAVLLIDTGIEGARIVGESLRRTVELHRCALENGVPVAFTISVGIASEVPMVQESSLTLVAAADKALYRAKRSGRNRVEVHAWQTVAIPELSGPNVGESDLLLDADA